MRLSRFVNDSRENCDDYRDPAESEHGVRTELHSLELHDRDTVLLCSDGLTEMVPENRIAEVLGEAEDPRAAAEALVTEANCHGGDNNIAVIVARLSENVSPGG